MSGIEVGFEEPDLLAALAQRDSDLWLQPALLRHLQSYDLLVARRGQNVLAYWPIPTTSTATGRYAMRDFRHLPYSGPHLAGQLGQFDRFVIVERLGHAICGRYEGLSLPLPPRFTDAAALAACGMHLEWRNTHVFKAGDDWCQLASEMFRRSVSAARARVTVEASASANAFQFRRAGGVPDDATADRRRRFAEDVEECSSVCVLSALSAGSQVGQVCLLVSGGTAMLAHSWADRSAQRGVAALLLTAAKEWVESRGLRELDLEGSILAGVNHFYTSSGAAKVAFPYAHWHRQLHLLGAQIIDSLTIPGRSRQGAPLGPTGMVGTPPAKVATQ